MSPERKRAIADERAAEIQPPLDRAGRSSRSIACASSSPRMICSVKFFEPTRITASARGDGGQHQAGNRDAATAAATASRPRAGGRARSHAACSARSASSSAPSTRQRQRRRRHRAGEDHRRIDHRQPAEDVFAEPAGADRRGDRRGADADDRRDADAGDDRRQRQRQLDLPEQLARRHAERRPGLDQRAIDAAHARDRRPDDRQQRVEDQHDDRDARAEAADQRQRQQESEHRQAGNRLDDVGEPDERRAQPRPPRGEDAERHADRDRRRASTTPTSDDVLRSSRPRNSARCVGQNSTVTSVMAAARRASSSGSSSGRTARIGGARERARRVDRDDAAVRRARRPASPARTPRPCRA